MPATFADPKRPRPNCMELSDGLYSYERISYCLPNLHIPTEELQLRASEHPVEKEVGNAVQPQVQPFRSPICEPIQQRNIHTVIDENDLKRAKRLWWLKCDAKKGLTGWISRTTML